MGYLTEKTALKLLVNGNGLVENFQKNSIELVNMYSKTSPDVQVVRIQNIKSGGFYHLTCLNESNWMRNAPVFIVDYRKVSGKIIFFGVNLNFIPLEIRVLFFDKFISEKDFEKNNFIKATFDGVYNELKSIGFEYALMEFDASKIVFAHKISMYMLPKFLISAHPTNKYDPRKLYSIWKTKIETSKQRDQEMQQVMLEDFFNVQKDINDKYVALKDHIMRVRRNL